MAVTTDPASLVDLARRFAAGFPQQRSPRRSAQRVAFPRTPASPLVARRMPSPPSHYENRGFMQIGVIGLGSQGPAQALKLKNYLAAVDSDIRVKVGLNEGTRPLARAAGFTEEDGTLGDRQETISGSNIVWLLLPDMTLEAHHYETMFSLMKPNSILVVSDGFPRAQLRPWALDNQKHIIAIDVNPEDMGPLVIELYSRGQEINAAGRNSDFHVYQEESLPAFLMGKIDRTTMRNLGLLIVAFTAGALVTSALGQAGGLPSMVDSFSTRFRETNPFLILLWVAALWLWYIKGNLLKCSDILLSVFSAAVLAISILSISKVQPTGAGCPTLPCDGARSGSCDPPSAMACFSQNVTVSIQNNWNPS